MTKLRSVHQGSDAEGAEDAVADSEGRAGTAGRVRTRHGGAAPWQTREEPAIPGGKGRLFNGRRRFRRPRTGHRSGEHL